MLHTLHGSSGHTSCMPIYKFAAPDYKIRARQPHSEREREWERENVWLRLWPERSKFVAMTHDYVDHYDSRQASKQAILIMMIEKPFARPGSLEWCQWLEINCPSIAQKDNNNNNQNNNRIQYQKRTRRRTNALWIKVSRKQETCKKVFNFLIILKISITVRSDTFMF